MHKYVCMCVSESTNRLHITILPYDYSPFETRRISLMKELRESDTSVVSGISLTRGVAEIPVDLAQT